jgi:predicted DNA-binding transcriptional regulator AlpA
MGSSGHRGADLHAGEPFMRDRDLALLRDFDALPDSALVRLPIVMALFSISRATVWRWCGKGELPVPIHVGGVTFWNVGELRERLRTAHAGQAPRQSGNRPDEPTQDDPKHE